MIKPNRAQRRAKHPKPLTKLNKNEEVVSAVNYGAFGNREKSTPIDYK